MDFYTAPLVVTSLLALGMAFAFTVADRYSPASRALALFLGWVGIAIAVTVLIEIPVRNSIGVPAWSGLFALPESLACIFGYEWVIRVGRTAAARKRVAWEPEKLLRAAQGLVAIYGLVSLFFPGMRTAHFSGTLDPEPGGWAWTNATLYVFGLPIGLSLLLGTVGGVLTLMRSPDRAEMLRLLAFVIGAPFMASPLVLPGNLAAIPTAMGMLIFLVGAVQYHVVQGGRAKFMSRFLAPQVAELVRQRGLKSATDDKTVELSVVCCDLRGFTAFSAATSSTKVIRILRDYYEAVGAAAEAVGGTIKDQAGDGVLILVGAPVAFDDHARRAFDLAKRIRDSGTRVTSRWSDAELQLGVGVGVASGYVTVGVIGSASRLEYTAVGPAVNLAARLCSEASHGEVLVDVRTTELLDVASGRFELELGESLLLKGFPQPVQSYVLPGAATAPPQSAQRAAA